jgi:hypothetical protein
VQPGIEPAHNAVTPGATTLDEWNTQHDVSSNDIGSGPASTKDAIEQLNQQSAASSTPNAAPTTGATTLEDWNAQHNVDAPNNASTITERLHEVAQASPLEARQLAEAVLSLKHDPSVFAQIVEAAHHMEPNPQLAQELPYVKGPETYLLQDGHLAVFGHAPAGSTLSDVEAQQNLALHIAKETGQNVEVRAEQGQMFHIARPDGSLITQQVSVADRIMPPDIRSAVLKVPKF